MAVADAWERVSGGQRYRFTVDEFARMGEVGIFTEDDRVELLDGAIYEMTPIGPPHAWIVDRLTELLVTRLAGRAHVRVQNPVRLGRHTEPQPDLTVARRRGSYADRHPESGDVLLIVEVADSSLRYDRTQKMPRYSRSGIPETWLVDVEAGAVTVYTEPGPDGYTKRQTRQRGSTLVATRVPDLVIAVDELFGAQR